MSFEKLRIFGLGGARKVVVSLAGGWVHGFGLQVSSTNKQ